MRPDPGSDWIKGFQMGWRHWYQDIVGFHFGKKMWQGFVSGQKYRRWHQAQKVIRKRKRQHETR